MKWVRLESPIEDRLDGEDVEKFAVVRDYAIETYSLQGVVGTTATVLVSCDDVVATQITADTDFTVLNIEDI